MDAADVLMKEYDTLRREILATLTHRTQIVSLGLTAVSALYAGSFLIGSPSEHVSLFIGVFSGAIPLASVFILYMWLAEIERMWRASIHLLGVECRVNAILGDELLTWERTLRQPGRRFWYHHWMVVGFFTLIAAGAPLAGLSVTHGSFVDDFWEIIRWALPVLGSLAVFLNVRTRIRTGQKRMSKPQASCEAGGSSVALSPDPATTILPFH